MAVYTAIDDAGLYFNPVIYTGTGSSLAVTGVGFQPDFTWIKNRDAADFHVLTDSVRGATKYWQSNSDATPVTDTETLKSFDSDGFTVGTTAQVNTNTEDYDSWNWKAGTTTGIAGSPSITPESYSFNATSGCSIIKYVGNGTSGATLPHGLGTADIGMIIVKAIDAVRDPVVYHKYLGATKLLTLNGSPAADTATNMWNDTEPTSTLFSLGDSVKSNANTENFIAYCFAEIQGYSKFGSYVGSGNADGPFIYTGFSPNFVMWKASSATSRWPIFDQARSPYNVQPSDNFSANSTAAEISGDSNCLTDFLSNGFKLRMGNDSDANGTGVTYIFVAFAHAPFVNSSGVPVNAR